LASNPRIEDLRRRLDREPGSRLFAQLAEELRKDGDLEEAIRVSREGLQKHPAYPSARMTLGRALLDTGDIAAARTEFEIVLKGAPDNILASRFLGECLEGVGDLAGARDRFKATLALAPGDKVVTAHLQEVEAKLKKAAPAGAAPAATGIPRGREEPAEAPIPLSRVDEPMELERSAEARTIASRPQPGPSPESTVLMSATPARPPAPPAPPARPAANDEGDAPPIPLVAAEEDFELERPYGAPDPSAPPAPSAPAAHTAAAAAGGFESSGPAPEFEFDLAPEGGVAGAAPEPWEPSPAATVRLPEPMPEPEAEPPIPRPPPAIAAPVPPPPMPVPPPPPREREAIPQTEVPERAAAPPLPPPVFAPTPPPPPRMDVAPAPEADELTSSTLAELYFNQGFTDKAIEVYRQLLQREPGNQRGRTRLAELEALERRLAEEETRAAGAAGGGPADAAAGRRQAIERTIARLEGLLAALRKE